MFDISGSWPQWLTPFFFLFFFWIVPDKHGLFGEHNVLSADISFLRLLKKFLASCSTYITELEYAFGMG